LSDAIDITPAEAALLRRERLDTVANAFGYSGGEKLTKPGLGHRERIRLRLTDDEGREVEWYLKRYGPPLEEMGAHHCCGGSHDAGHLSPAEAELRAVRMLESAGVATERAVAFGAEPDMWGTVRSYLIVEAVPGDALERCFEDFTSRHDGADQAVSAFNAALVELLSGLHGAGLAHRDLYASHIFLHEGADGPELSLIDLARVLRPRWRRFRWRVKDLAQLKYSMPPAWVAAHWDGVLAAWHGRVGGRKWGLEAAIDRKVASMRRRSRRKEAKQTETCGEDRCRH